MSLEVALLLVLVVVVGVGLIWLGPVVAQGVQLTVQAPSPVVVPAPQVTIQRGPAAGATIELLLVGPSGQREGVYRVDETRRPPKVERDGVLYQAVCQTTEGQWVYRRAPGRPRSGRAPVGVEAVVDGVRVRVTGEPKPS